MISKALFIECAEALEEARRKLATDFNAKQLKYNRRHIRHVIPDGATACENLILVVKAVAAQNKIAKQNWDGTANGQSGRYISPLPTSLIPSSLGEFGRL